MDEVFKRMVVAARKKGADGNSDIANLLNESPQVITNWSRRGVPRYKIVNIAGALGVTVEWLLTGKESGYPAPPPDQSSNDATPMLTPRQQVLLNLFESLTDDQQDEYMRSLEAQKQQNKIIWEQLSKVMGKK